MLHCPLNREKHSVPHSSNAWTMTSVEHHPEIPLLIGNRLLTRGRVYDRESGAYHRGMVVSVRATLIRPPVEYRACHLFQKFHRGWRHVFAE